MKNSLFVLAFVGLGLVGCKDKKSTTTATYSCTVSSASVCMQYGDGFTADTAEAACTQLSGTYATEACATTDSVGSCAITTQGLSLTTTYYSTLFNAATAEASCTDSSGTFTAAE